MRVNKVRIQHFQCIADSGELVFDERLTVLVGKNESGKSAILKALSYFNEGMNFQPADLSTLSGIEDKIDRGQIKSDEVEIVSVWASVTSEDRLALGPHDDPSVFENIKIVKTLNNEYRVEFHAKKETPPPETLTPHRKLLLLIDELKKKLEGVYTGRVKDKLPMHSFVWIEREEDEPWSQNVILFPEWAPAIWEELETGDLVQVTRLAEDPYGRNTRALNAGRAIDIEPSVAALTTLAEVLQSTQKLDEGAMGSLHRAVEEIPNEHPLRDYLNAETIREIRHLSMAETVPKSVALDPKNWTLANLPEFVYLPALPEVSDSIAVRSLGTVSSEGDPDALFHSLVRASGLQPAAITEPDELNRERMLKRKSAILSTRLRERWFNQNVAFEFKKDGQRLAIWVDSDGSHDPLSRRSSGLRSYVSLFAQMADLSSRGSVIPLLDDPGVFLHPMAQKQMLPLLDSQPFQVVMATHLPYMIDPEHIERVRAVTRVNDGTCLEGDWEKAKDSLATVWGSVIVGFPARVWLLVEGPGDARAYLRLSKFCKGKGKSHLTNDIGPFPSGGSNLPSVADFLISRGIPLIVLADGDKSGRSYQDKVRTLGMPAKAVLTLNDMALNISKPDFELEDLFTSKEEAGRAKSDSIDKATSFDDKTVERFDTIFSRITAVYNDLYAKT